MSRTDKAIYEINQLNSLALRDQWMNRVHPLVKLILTLFYIILVVSFHKYDAFGCFGMMIYPWIMFMISELSFFQCIKRLRLVLPFVILLGIMNPLFDKNIILVANMTFSAGIISMITLFLKAIFCIFASYILIATTTMEQICYSLRLLHVPKILVLQIQLTYRYISVLLEEVDRLLHAYALRAPGQKGLHISTWGSLVGQLLLRSYDRANEIYDSMQLRGFNGEFKLAYSNVTTVPRMRQIIFMLVWILVLLLFRIFPVVLWIGVLGGRLFL